jgi:hypothetical protein
MMLNATIKMAIQDHSGILRTLAEIIESDSRFEAAAE